MVFLHWERPGIKHSVLLTRASGFKTSAFVLLIGLSAASIMVIGLYLIGFDAVAALRDRSLSEVPEAGLISYMGIFLMGVGVAAASFEAVRTDDLPLGALALFCWLFSIDDAFLIHEALGAWEVVFFAVYGLLAAIALFLLSKSEGRLSWPILVAIAAFAFSVSVDVSWDRAIGYLQLPSESENFYYRVGYVLEDVPKFGGIFVLSSCAIGEFMVRGHGILRHRVDGHRLAADRAGGKPRTVWRVDSRHGMRPPPGDDAA